MPKPVDDASHVLVLGATGSFGAAAALELLSRGVPVRLFIRDLELARRRFGNRANATYLTGDTADDAALLGAMRDCRAVVVALPFTHESRPAELARLAALVAKLPARPADAPPTHIVAPVPFPDADSVSTNPSLTSAATDARMRLTLVSIGPLFGPTVRHWIIDSLCRAALDWKTLRFPGDLNAPSTWTYAPDAARLLTDFVITTPVLSPNTGSVLLLHVPHITGSQQAFLTQLATAAIRLTTPSGAPNGVHDEPRVASLSTLARRIAGTLDRRAASALAEFHRLSCPAADASSLQHPLIKSVGDPQRLDPQSTPLEVALRMTITSYRQSLRR